MEAINNLASVATKAIWGENNNDGVDKDQDATIVSKSAKEEPISGVQGDTAKGEPFDAGNMEDANFANRPEADSKIKANSKPEADPTVVDKPSSNMKADSTEHQSDVRDPKDAGEHHKEEQKKDVDDVEPLAADKLKGPGPKPLEVVARERGGDAGNLSEAKTTPDESAKNEAEKKDSPKVNENGEPLGVKHVGSTGLAADGGDFDAAKPGAGIEAEKILHDKGIHTTDKAADKKDTSPTRDAASPTGTSTGESPDRKGVRGLGRKIKDKLRRSSQS